MSQDKIRLTLNPDSDNLQYDIDMIDEVADRQNKPATSITLPGQSYKKNILMGIGGQEADIEIFFSLHDDGTDKSNGTNSSTVTSLPEQMNYLKNKIQTPDFISSWTIVDNKGIYGDLGNENNGLQVFVENIEITPFASESPTDKWFQGRISLIVGEGQEI